MTALSNKNAIKWVSTLGTTSFLTQNEMVIHFCGETFMKKLQTTFLLTLATALCVGCSHKPPVPEPLEPMDEVSILKGANVREVSVLWTQDSIGGAAERQSEWADYFYDDHHRGVGVKVKNVPSPTEAKKDGKNGVADSAKDKSIYAKDKSIYSKDRFIYTKDRSIYAKPKAKKHKKVVAPAPVKKKVAPSPQPIKKVKPPKAEPKKLVAHPPHTGKVQAKPFGDPQSKANKVTKAESKQEVKKPKTMPRPKLMKAPTLQSVQTSTVEGKKVAKTIVELKDAPMKKEH